MKSEVTLRIITFRRWSTNKYDVLLELLHLSILEPRIETFIEIFNPIRRRSLSPQEKLEQFF